MKRKRGRPSLKTIESGYSSKQLIIDTALGLFYKKGYRAVGIDELIREAKVSKMTLFKYFPTKHDLVVESLKVRDARFNSWFLEKLKTIKNNKKNKIENSLAVVEMWLGQKDFRGCGFLNAIVELGPADGPEKKICVRHISLLSDFLEKAAKESGYKQPKLMANQLLTVIHGALTRAQFDTTKEAVKALRDSADPILQSHL